MATPNLALVQQLASIFPSTSVNGAILQRILANPSLLSDPGVQQTLAQIQTSSPGTNPTPVAAQSSTPAITGTPGFNTVPTPTPSTGLSGSGRTFDPSASTGSFRGQRPGTGGTTLGGGNPTQPPATSPAPIGTPGFNTVPTNSTPTQSPGTSFTPISINNPASANQPMQTQFPAGSGDPLTGGYNIPMGPVAGGANPVFQNWSNTPGGNGQGYQGGDPGYMASAEANRAIDYGNNFEQQYGSQYQQALAQQNQYQNMADMGYNQLAQTPGYTDQEASAIQANPYAVNDIVGQTQQAMGSAIDPTKLGMSDQQVQQLKDQAAGQIGAQYGAAEDQLQRQAEASGNVNPLALSAARDRLLRSQAIDSADALTNADIAATGAQRQANTNIANMRLGAATTLGGMGLNASQYADTSASNRAANIAQQRIQGQQAARNYWQSQGQFQGSQANQASQARLAGAQTSLSGMGQGGQLAANTEAERKANGARLGVSVGGVSVNTGI